MEAILKYILTTLIGMILGFLVKTLKKEKEKKDIQCNAIKSLLKSNLVNQFYIYKDLGKVPHYVKQSWYDMYNSYIKLNGNSFVKEDLKPKWDELESFRD